MVVLKTSKELAKMKRAGSISAQALQVGGAAVRPGVTTGEIDRAVRSFIQSKGAIPSFLGYGGFPGSACVSVNDEIIHGIPGGRVIQEGDIVSIDVGAIVDGYHGDNAATFAAGRVSDAAQKLMDATRESLLAAIAVAKPGARLGDIGYAVQSYVEALGYGVVREYVGHGIGTEMHEEPEVPNYGRPGHGVRLVPGMVIAIEPMITEGSPALHVLDNDWTVVTNDHKLAAHFEHTVAITESGPVILTLP
ncbi:MULTISPECIES: type I methionyl aminopeptidase [Anaerotruncus]|jgi:methionyl aminopeptidase|uniref:Methionine aminopeptidase n=2 Tax=Anaerotruncus TaxID=244127 RepID=A0A498CTM2_9FIRM|nr:MULTISPECIES: type I methionyl aminopeptidase [Anaerotruncus]MBC3939364.1 type I methionyl aminopeptidase [Anaerotruncus massiliensis (ex Togo et al. 2019)]MCQ4896352.1 type I methionyl aminopeptidase [Anaerotruncus sp. DFI.9.16]RLL09545.1 type I methionyl aminopeptidase [Anaerotruncus massiliensis (ex Liu et al. 2021)]GKH48677.1 methionine aminopeptidase [Oscillospiraceae bacterium]